MILLIFLINWGHFQDHLYLLNKSTAYKIILLYFYYNIILIFRISAARNIEGGG